MLSRAEQDELDRLEKRFQKNRRGLSKDEQAELDRLEKRYQKSLAAKVKEPEAKPEIHVHVDLPEITTTQQARTPEPCVVAPRKWVFEHKYDEYGKLVKTTATAL